MTDADMDGVTDIDELIDNTDPNSVENRPICSEVRYGCGARIAPRQGPRPETPFHSGSALALVLALFLVRRCNARSARLHGSRS